MKKNYLPCLKKRNALSFMIQKSTYTFRHSVLFLMVVMTFGLTLQMHAQSPEPIICSTPEVEQDRLGEKYQIYFEKFEEYIAEQKLRLNQERATVYTIPIVYHIVHDNDALGTGDNISTAFINAQTEQLNNDFRKVMGTSGDGTGVDIEIQFCAAVVDENGNTLAEPGVNRIDRNDKGWTAPPYGEPVFGCLLGVNLNYIDNTIKPESQWDPEKYFNVWVLDMECGVVGYAQFPEAPSLDGIGTGNGSADSDGVVMLPTAIGSSDMPVPGGGAYNQGRVLAHEVGHWLGLRHVWGDGGCDVDDFCEDTPTTGGSNRGCPDVDSCPNLPGRDQVENHMDYTDDFCKSAFTQDQKDRMRIVMGDTGEGSPRREILINSTACQGGTPPTCDDGIQNGLETDVDCGGPDCPACPPSCDDGIQNGDEEGVDCGGSDCPPCNMEMCDTPTGLFETNNTGSQVTLNWTAVAAANNYTVQGRQQGVNNWQLTVNSNTNSTTLTNNIVNGVTYEWRVRSNCDGEQSPYSEVKSFVAGDNGGGPTCDDGIQNGDEEGIDCGGSDCPPCMVDPTCDDGIQNGDEEGVDCGGSDCPPCMVDPTCDDGIQNGMETGIDCGGPDCPPCNMGDCDTPTGLTTTNIQRRQATFSWNAVSDANDYTVQLRRTGTASWRTRTTASTSFVARPLRANTQHEWRVRSNCDDGSSDYSAIQTFTTTNSSNNTLESRGEEIEATSLWARAFPSPTSEILIIEVNKSIDRIQVLDITGRTIRIASTDLHSDKIQLNVADLAKGHYYIRLQANSDVKTLRFVKQ